MLSTSLTQQHRVASLTTPDTPPGLVSPSSSTYSSNPSEGPSNWRVRSIGPLSPPMSSYDQPPFSALSDDIMSTRASDDGQARKPSPSQHPISSSGRASRQQLPSLSSLFPLDMRTLPSPRLERPPPLYPATSPLDHPRGADGYLDRAGSTSSYFPTSASSSSTSTTQHPSRTILEAEFDRGAPQTRAAFHPQLSSGLREPRHVYPTDASSRWSYHQEMSRSSDYSPGGQEHSTRYHTRRLSGHTLSHDGYSGSISSSSSSRDYHGHADLRTHPHRPAQQQQQQQQQQDVTHHPHAQQSSPTPTGETSPTKDGLGPKIWTGTHFLPRFVRAAEVPGEGMCYFYDDGSHCKTTIDGEVVNAHWGVTKAGKPRKRLAIACITCREKKIKCDPDYPRCVQCEKFGRICKFKNAPRGGGHHNTSPTSESGDHVESTQRRVQPYEHSQRTRHSPSVSPRTTMPSLTLAGGSAKRAKNESSYSVVGGREHNQTPAWQQQQQRAYGLAGQLPLPRLHDDLFRQQQWRSDPYVPDARYQEILRRTDGARA